MTGENAFFIALVQELNSERNFQLLALRVHLYVESKIDELFKKEFNCAKIDLIMEKLTFEEKLSLLKKADVFREKESVYRNVKLIQEIRNKYAHNLLESNILPLVTNKINLLEWIKNNPEEGDPQLESNKVDTYKRCVIPTLLVIQEILITRYSEE